MSAHRELLFTIFGLRKKVDSCLGAKLRKLKWPVTIYKRDDYGNVSARHKSFEIQSLVSLVDFILT